MTLFDFFVQPFLEYDFMTRALLASWAIALAGAPVGVFLMFRRLALMGDALSHALLPGAAIGYLFAGLYFPALFFGGLLAGLVVAGLASGLAELTSQKEDNSLATLYLLSLAGGVLIVSHSGNSVDLLHLLFGSVLALDDLTFQMVLGGAFLTLLLFFFFGRALLFEALDPQFLRRSGFPIRRVHFLFLFLVVLTLVIGFQALGTLMALGMILIPASAARLITSSLRGQILCSSIIGMSASYLGLLLSYHANWPSGPAIVLCCGAFFVLSVLFGPTQGIWRRFFPHKHRLIHPVLILLSGISFAPKDHAQAPEPLHVVATFSIPADWARELGGKAVEVQSLIVPGQDPHGFQPTVRDLKILKKADLFISIGWGFDSWAAALRKSSGSQAPLLVLSEGLQPLRANSAGHDHAHTDEDPHFWHDPTRSLVALGRLRDQLTKLRPADRDLFSKNYDSLKMRLEEITARGRKALSTLPTDQRTALSSHESFHYLGEAFDLRFVSPQGLRTDQELSAARLADVEKKLRQGRIRAVFWENGHPSVPLQNLVKELHLPAATLYGDSLGPPGSEAGTYLQMFDSNVQRLIQTFSAMNTVKKEEPR